MGIVTFFFPEFLLSGMVYVIAGYAILNGTLSIADHFLNEEVASKAINYGNLIFACLFIIFGILSIVYFRYLVSILPVFLGVLIVIKGFVYFMIALHANTSTKPILIILAVSIMIGGIVANIFTFGFGGVLTLSHIFGTLLMLSCAYELIFYLIHRKTAK
jgi:uncharacterized membrane protein HdeD (DUF308 family)